MNNPTNTQIRDRLNRAKDEPVTAGLALELMPLLETVLDELEVAYRVIDSKTKANESLQKGIKNTFIVMDKLKAAEAKLKAASQVPRYRVWIDKHSNLNWVPDSKGYWIRPFELEAALKEQPK